MCLYSFLQLYYNLDFCFIIYPYCGCNWHSFDRGFIYILGGAMLIYEANERYSSKDDSRNRPEGFQPLLQAQYPSPIQGKLIRCLQDHHSKCMHYIVSCWNASFLLLIYSLAQKEEHICQSWRTPGPGLKIKFLPFLLLMRSFQISSVICLKKYLRWDLALY